VTHLVEFKRTQPWPTPSPRWVAGQKIVSKVPVTFCLTINWNVPDDKVDAYIAGAVDVLRATAQAVG
jgi:hypothetical protein